MSADVVQFEEYFAGQLTEREVSAPCEPLERSNEIPGASIEQHKIDAAEQSTAARVPFDCRVSSF